MITSNSKSKCILVLGMHRSGTSAMTRNISILGAKLPKNLLGSAPGNEEGHWEPSQLASYNEQLMNNFGSAWHDWKTLDLKKIPKKKKDVIATDIYNLLQNEYSRNSLIVLKEPRISRFGNLYLDTLYDLGFRTSILVMFRNPIDVIESLTARNHLWPENYDNIDAALLWLRYTLDSELISRKCKNNIFVSYENMMANPLETMEKVSNSFDCVFPNSVSSVAKEIKNFIKPNLHHHKHSYEDILQNSHLSGWIADVYKASIDLEQGHNIKGARKVFDDIRKKLDLFSPFLSKLTILRSSIIKDQDALISDLNNDLERILLDINYERNTVIKPVYRNIYSISRIILSKFLLFNSKKQKLDNKSNLKFSQKRTASDRIRWLNIEKTKALVDDQFEKLKTSTVLESGLTSVRSDLIKLRETLLENLYKNLEESSMRLDAEKHKFWRPFYRNIFSACGMVLRKFLPVVLVEEIRKRVPNPEGIVKQLQEVHHSPVYQKSIKISDISPATDKSDIFILSIIDWDFRTQRPQHIARELSKFHRVFYVEMDSSSKYNELQKIMPTLYKLRLNNSNIGYIKPYVGEPKIDQCKSWLKALKDFCRNVSATSVKKIIIQHPYWWQFAKHLPPEFEIIFDCMDDISGFSNTTQKMIEIEKDLLKNCDKLIVSSDYLSKKYKSFSEPKLIRNAGQVEHFKPKKNNKLAPKFLAKIDELSKEKINIGYVGAISDWFDVDLIKEAAIQNSHLIFHLCGAVTNSKATKLYELPNVNMYGEVPYEEVPAFIRQMDVMIIPFKLTPIIQACDPVKFYEYSSMGKPTISSKLPELIRLKDLIYFFTSTTDFVEKIKKATQDSYKNSIVHRLKAFSRNNTWIDRALQFEEVLLDAPKVSVVILSYGDPNLTLNALHSLVSDGGNYINMEIIIVDNGSSEIHINLLRAEVAKHKCVQIIENGANFGFSKGNNIGIKASTGEYVMLLNNDTYVSPGAIASMVKHLQRSPEIGVVGPLTNNIGNEAKIFVNYSNMEEMKELAFSLTTGYRGRFSTIGMNAYFSAMFRKKDFNKFGLLCEGYGVGMFEDDDHCAMIKSKGYICALAEDAFVHHHLSATFSTIEEDKRKAVFNKNKKLFEKRWGPWISHKYRFKRPQSTLDFGN